MNAIFLSDVFFKWTLLNALFVQAEFAIWGAHVSIIFPESDCSTQWKQTQTCGTFDAIEMKNLIMLHV